MPNRLRHTETKTQTFHTQLAERGSETGRLRATRYDKNQLCYVYTGSVRPHLSAGRTSGDQGIASPFLLEPIGSCCDQSYARGSEGMAYGERPAPSVELLDGNLSDLCDKSIIIITVTDD